MFIALPEILTLALALLVLLVDLCFSKRVWVTMSVSLFGLMAILLVVFDMQGLAQQTAFYGHYYLDQSAVLLKISVIILTMIAMLYAYVYLSHEDTQNPAQGAMLRGEYFTLVILALLGMMVVISAGSMVSAYLGLEMTSLTLYGMVAWNKKHTEGSEAAIKYFVLGSIASGLLLYGMSLIYGATGTLLLSDIAFNIYDHGNLLLFGLVFVLVGISFKLGVIPFHMWLPDVYQGASITVTTFIASVVKIAMFALLLRLWIESIEVSHEQIQLMLVFVALGSIVLGNMVAIVQSNIRRMLAYSSIAHMGFVVLGALANNDQGAAASLFYVLIYALMSLSGFALLSFMRFNDKELNNIDELKGLGKSQPWVAFLILILMFSMAGIPPTVGFYAKLTVLQAIVESGFYYEAIIAVVFSVIGSFYYLRVVRYMYFDKTDNNDNALYCILFLTQTWSIAKITLIILSVNVLLLIALGIYPTFILNWAFSVF